LDPLMEGGGLQVAGREWHEAAREIHPMPANSEQN